MSHESTGEGCSAREAQVIASLRAARKHRVESLAPSAFLHAAAETGAQQLCLNTSLNSSHSAVVLHIGVDESQDGMPLAAFHTRHGSCCPEPHIDPQVACAGDLGVFAAVYRFCHDTVQPPLPAFGSVLAEYAQWLPEKAGQTEVATLVGGQAA